MKLVLTAFATAALFIHQSTATAEAARLAADGAAPLLRSGRPHELGVQLVADSTIAAVLLRCPP